MTIKYHISSRIIHWLMALLIFGLLPIGIYMVYFLPEDAANRLQIYSLHKSFGVAALILIFIRIFNYFLHKAPKLPQGLPKIEKIASNIAHVTLYTLMIVIPISGYLMSNAYGFSVNLFTIPMPNLISSQPETGAYLVRIHQYSAYAIIAVIGLHIGGTLKHRFFDKPENDVLKRML
ncbi:MAG: cytochrome b [Rickettsiales bacterium]|nr:cytochrome b [Rickettsiales bacterium]